MKRIFLAAACACAASLAHADNPAEVVELGRSDVVGVSPLPGLGVPLAQVPANVQGVRLPQGRDPFAALPTAIDRVAAGTALATGQGNSFQPDFTFRGFVASPLLGQPQGISVFQDGVRLNEPFGDVVNWDLLPAAAIGSAQLLPGSSPLFGPNTLGGVLALYTRSGAEYPGGSAELQGGAFGRRALVVEQGGWRGAWDWFATADALHESGWSAHNPSLLRRAFVKVGHQTEESDIDVSVTVANNALQGSQALPVSFLGDVRQPYTWPDINRNRLAMLAAKGSRFLAEGVLLGATAYWRRFRNENLSSNVNGDAAGPAATNDLSTIGQRAYGVGVQVTLARPLAGHENVLIAGSSLDVGDARYTRLEQPATFSAAREAVGTAPFEPDTQARTDSRRGSVFASDTYAFAAGWSATLSGRYDRSTMEIADLSGLAPALEGRHRFGRFNPAAGITRQVAAGATAYAAYSESMRAPTAMELTCADPGAPCRLPNAFLSDPALRPVVARTVEVGARGGAESAWRWSAALFRTAIEDDIQFVSSDSAASTAGYFRNVGATRRQGAELSIERRWERTAMTLRYSHVDATFRSSFREASPNHASADASGTIAIAPGQRIPGVPRDALRLALEGEPHPGWSLQGTISAAGRQWARGDENNADPAGIVPGHAVAGVHARWQLDPHVSVALLVDNVFDVRYARSGVLGRNFFAAESRAFDPASARTEAFRGPGAPRGAWLSLRWRWD